MAYTKRKQMVNGKMRNVDYIAYMSKCSKLECFIPFNGNGKAICRLYELGKCTEGKGFFKSEG